VLWKGGRDRTTKHKTAAAEAAASRSQEQNNMQRMCGGSRLGCVQTGGEPEITMHEAQCVMLAQDRRIQQLEQAIKFYIDSQNLALSSRIDVLVAQTKQMQFRQDTALVHRVQLAVDVQRTVRLGEVQKYGAARFSIGQGGTSLGEFACPKGVSIDEERGLAFVCDKDNHRVQVFDLSDRSVLLSIGQEGNGPGAFFKNPSGLALDLPSKRLFVCDTGNHRIQVFDIHHESHTRTPRIQHSCSFGGYGTSLGQLLGPCAVAFDPSAGNIVVCDTYNNRVQIFDPSFQAVKTFGSKGTSNGLFSSPLALTVDQNGLIFVCDTGNHRIQVFDMNGTRTKTFGSEGTTNNQFKHPSGVAIDRLGFLFVCDSHNHRVHIYDQNLKHLRVFGSEGSDPSQFFYPAGIALCPNLTIVCDTHNNRLQLF